MSQQIFEHGNRPSLAGTSPLKRPFLLFQSGRLELLACVLIHREKGPPTIRLLLLFRILNEEGIPWRKSNLAIIHTHLPRSVLSSRTEKDGSRTFLRVVHYVGKKFRTSWSEDQYWLVVLDGNECLSSWNQVHGFGDSHNQILTQQNRGANRT